MSDLGLCPVCRKGCLQPATHMREFAPNGVLFAVELQTSRCDQCGETTTKAFQHKENLRKLAARKSLYGDVLMGEEILSLRKRYGITQQQAAQIFGKGIVAFSRYESETTYPDKSTTLLLKLAIENPVVIKSLADKAGISLPLWEKRQKERRGGFQLVSEEGKPQVRTYILNEKIPAVELDFSSAELDETVSAVTSNIDCCAVA